MRKLLISLLVLVSGSALLAQTQVIPTSYQIQFYTALTGGSVVASTVLPSTAYECNVTPSTPLPTARYVASWDDPADARTWDNNPSTVPNECRYPDPGSGGFVTSPPNVTVYVTIRGGVVQSGNVVYGPESEPRLAFTNWVTPNAVPGFRVRPGSSATLQGVINDIYPNWSTPNQPTWRIANFTSVFGPFQMHVGTPDGIIRLPDYGPIEEGDLYELTIVKRPTQ